MSTFALVPTEMRAGAATAESAAGSARAADGSEALTTLAGALPGSTTAETAPQLGAAWSTGVTDWAEQVADLGATIDSLTDDATSTDTGAGAGFGALGGRITGTQP